MRREGYSNALNMTIANLKKNTRFMQQLEQINKAAQDQTANTEINIDSLIIRSAGLHLAPEVKDALVNQIITPGLIVEGIVKEEKDNYFVVQIHRLLTIALDDHSQHGISKKLKSVRKRIKRFELEPREVIQETRKFGLTGILTHTEIACNSHLSYMLNKQSIKIGEHIHCVILEDLIQIENATCLCLSLNNQRIAGRVQIPMYLVYTTGDDDRIHFNDDNFLLLGFSEGVPNESLKFLQDEESKNELESKIDQLDYNLDRTLVKAQTDPNLYNDLLCYLGVRENETLLHYANSKHYKDGPNYAKLRQIQNNNWAKHYYKKGLILAERQKFEQAIVYYSHAIEYDQTVEDIYIAKAQALVNLEKNKSALSEVNKCLNINPDNTDALMIKGRLEEELQIGDNLKIGQAELLLKGRPTNFNKDKLMFD